MSLRTSDRLPVVFRMYNTKGEVIFEERRVLALSTILGVQYAYTLTKPDACVMLTVEILFPEFTKEL